MNRKAAAKANLEAALGEFMKAHEFADTPTNGVQLAFELHQFLCLTYKDPLPLEDHERSLTRTVPRRSRLRG